MLRVAFCSKPQHENARALLRWNSVASQSNDLSKEKDVPTSSGELGSNQIWRNGRGGHAEALLCTTVDGLEVLLVRIPVL